MVEHQLLDVREGDVGAGLGVVEAAVRVLLDQALRGHVGILVTWLKPPQMRPLVKV